MSNKKLERCPLCSYAAVIQEYNPNNDLYKINCKRCGDYYISSDTTVDTDKIDILKKQGFILSGLSREYNIITKKSIIITNKNLKKLFEDNLIPDINNVDDKIYKLLDRIGEQSDYYGRHIQYNYDYDYPLGYAKNSQEFRAQFNLLSDLDYIQRESEDTGGITLSLSIKGWKLTKMIKEETKTDKVFIAAWFDESMDINIKAIMEATKDSGFLPICIKDEHFSEKIIDKALNEIRKSRFIIADLTGGRLSVFFEIGFANALGKNIIYVYKKDDKQNKEKSPLDFYVQHYQCNAYDNPERLKEIIKDAIGARIKK